MYSLRRNSILTFLLGAFVALPTVAFTAPSNTSEKEGMNIKENAVTVAQGDLTNLILESRDTLKEFVSGDKPTISQARLEGAECVLIFPTVNEAALIAGGKHGDGVASCKHNGKSWSNLAFVDIRGASIGAQLGVKSSSVVMLVKDKDAVEQLKKGKMMFTADMDFVFGNIKKGIQMREDEGSNVEVYSDTEGAFAAASLEGAYVASDEDELKAFYDNETTTIYSTLTAEPSDKSKTVVQELMILLPEVKSVS